MYISKIKRTAKNTSGFTLVELLVVILVISVLAGIVLNAINSQGIRAKARDAQRIADLKKLQAALELYFADNRRYPPTTANSWINATATTNELKTQLSPSYLNDYPTEPSGTNGSDATSCNNPTSYRYNYWSGGTSYILTAIMEISTSNDGNECGILNNWGTTCGGVSFATSDVCYGVQNP